MDYLIIAAAFSVLWLIAYLAAKFVDGVFAVMEEERKRDW